MPPRGSGKRRAVGSSAEEQAQAKRSKTSVLTVKDVLQDKLTPIANQYWAPGATAAQRAKFDPAIVQQIYEEDILAPSLSEDDRSHNLALLELSGYLENFLWPNWAPPRAAKSGGGGGGRQHILSILALVNEKFRQSTIGVWNCFQSDEAKFGRLLDAVVHEVLPGVAGKSKSGKVKTGLSLEEELLVIRFFIHAFQSLENPVVRKACLGLVGLPLWTQLTPPALAAQMREFPKLHGRFQKLQARLASPKPEDQELRLQAQLMPAMLKRFFQTLAELTAEDWSDVQQLRQRLEQHRQLQRLKNRRSAEEDSKQSENGDDDADAETETENEESGDGNGLSSAETERLRQWSLRLELVHRSLEWLTDMLSQLPTRRFLLALLQDAHVAVRARLTPLFADPGLRATEGRLFAQQLERLVHYLEFDIDPATGDSVTEAQRSAAHYARLTKLQRIAFRYFPEQLEELALGSASQLPALLPEVLSRLPLGTVEQLAVKLSLLPDPAQLAQAGEGLLEHQQQENTREFLQALLLDYVHLPPSQQRRAEQLPLYPSEKLVFDTFQVPTIDYQGHQCLSLPKLGLQFLTIHDYLLRNFELFRLEATYAIRQHLIQTVQRLRPRRNPAGDRTVFTGWARYAVPIHAFGVRRISPPALGEVTPERVTAEVTVDLSPFHGLPRQEWEEIKQHDVLFLVTVQAPASLTLDAAAGRFVGNGQGGRGGSDDHFVDLFARARRGENWQELNAQHLGVTYIRGAEVVAVLDEKSKMVGARNPDNGAVYQAQGNVRSYRLELDPAQFQLDRDEAAEATGAGDPYTTFNLLVRRDPRENNFKAVLHTIRGLLRARQSTAVPPALHDVFLGYGHPDMASYHALFAQQLQTLKDKGQPLQQTVTLRFADTFVNQRHLRESLGLPIRVNQRLPQVKGFSEPVAEDSKQQQEDEQDDSEQAELCPASFEVDFPLEALAQGPDFVVLQRRTRSRIERLMRQLDADLGVAADTPAMADDGKAEVDGEGAGGPTLQVRQFPPVVAVGLEQVRRNTVEFTPTQVEAIKAGLNPGLTLIQGPPGTGKTDVAVQIISELFHNHPEQRVLLVTHSNHALNDLFEKLLERSIPERYMLRLGRGQEALQSSRDFSKQGRVDFMLTRRLELLDQMKILAVSLGLPEDVAWSCETVHRFYLDHVLAAWERFLKEELRQAELPAAEREPEFFATRFPFTKFVQKTGATVVAGHPAMSVELFPAGLGWAQGKRAAYQAFAGIQLKFEELEECRPFELLRRGTVRGDYLLTKHARIIAMTCTHAAIMRDQLVALGFRYDNLVMEEAAQILEIETLIPMLLQESDPEAGNRLKRVVMLGDHHQLPPIIQNPAFDKYSNLGQSMFTRFVRLGVPVIQLDAQGRSRPSLAQLWSWRYPQLLHLPSVQPLGLPQTARVVRNLSSAADPSQLPDQAGVRLQAQRLAYTAANTGLAYSCQFVDVDEGTGGSAGESQPQAHFYQNLAEAEYLVQLYQYLRLMGVPGQRISVITPYNGQKALLKDVLQARCGSNPLFGMPASVSTVDQFQGQQNDFILLSLVRTRSAGHIRDIRRLVVAISRARLGLYIFGSKKLYANAFELQQAFHRLLSQVPNQLTLLPEERNKFGLPTLRRAALFDESELGEPAEAGAEDPERVAELLQLNQKYQPLLEAAGSAAGQPLDPRAAPEAAVKADVVLVNNLGGMAALVQKLTQQAHREWQEDAEVRRRWEQEQARAHAEAEERQQLLQAQQEAEQRERTEEARLLAQAEQQGQDAERAELLMQAVDLEAKREADEARAAADAELAQS